ncbi:MAG: FAD:protein FMN transferase [Ruminococcus sp.]|nr:FAD:protein FMN transferase [Ruminococcus sp.]
MKKIFSVFFALLTVLLSLCGCADAEKSTDEMFALDTIITFCIYSSDENISTDTISKCKDEIIRLENMLSATKKGSDVYNINHSDAKKVSVSDETIRLLQKARKLSESCDGAFDVSVYELVKLWGFDTKEYKVPTSDEVEKTLRYVGYSDVTIDKNDVLLKKGMSIDLGAIAKGYIGERLYDIMKNSEIDAGIINLGGMVVTYSSENSSKEFSVGVEYPDTGDVFAKLNVSKPFTVTSGGYQRYFEKDSKRYHHILDPKTGKPSESDISSVTVISDDGVANDALSTAFYVMGVDETLEYLKNHNADVEDGYSVIILSSDKSQVFVSEKLKADGFELLDGYEKEININYV